MEENHSFSVLAGCIMNIMPPPQPPVCEMPLKTVTDWVVVESLRCPYCLGAVEIRQGDNWTTYWCANHGAIENPISFTESPTGASGRRAPSRPRSDAPLAQSATSSGVPAGCLIGASWRTAERRPSIGCRYIPRLRGHRGEPC